MTKKPTSPEFVIPAFTSIPFMVAVAMSDQEAVPPGMEALGSPVAFWIRCSSHKQPVKLIHRTKQMRINRRTQAEKDKARHKRRVPSFQSGYGTTGALVHSETVKQGKRPWLRETGSSQGNMPAYHIF